MAITQRKANTADVSPIDVLRQQSRFSIIRHFLANPDRILPVLTEKRKIKNCSQWGLNPGHLDHHADALLNGPSQHLVACLNHHGLWQK